MDDFPAHFPKTCPPLEDDYLRNNIDEETQKLIEYWGDFLTELFG